MSDELAHDIVSYAAFLERRERRLRIAEDLARRPSDAVIVDEPPVRALDEEIPLHRRRGPSDQLF